MKPLASVTRLLVLPGVISLYLAVLFYNFSESDRRSLKLQEDVSDPEKVYVSVKIVSVNIERSEVTARLKFRLAGTIAKDEITPSVNLKFLVNAVNGQQAYQFRRGERITPIDATFSIEGESNKYPFDTYKTDLQFLIIRPERAKLPPSPVALASPAVPPSGRGILGGKRAKAATQPVAPPLAESARADVLASTAALESNDPVSVSFDLSASIPGIKFEKDSVNDPHDEVTRIPLKLQRARNVITVSISIMVMMMGLAVSLLAMVLYGSIKGKESVNLPLSVAVALIFGLPALRNAQPSVPPLGALSDYVSYIWAETITAVATVISIWMWIIRRYRRKIPADSQGNENM